MLGASHHKLTRSGVIYSGVMKGGTAEKFAGRLGAQQTKLRGKTGWYSMADRVCDM